jgi:lipopolysaccharide biosynthesis protein
MAEAREAQAEMAKKFGIHGFCYYHYWFNGRRILEKPVEEIFKSGKPDFPFMFCWANENWTRRWDGQENEVLLKQDYSDEDDIKHMESLIPYFKDERYIKVNGKPGFHNIQAISLT